MSFKQVSTFVAALATTCALSAVAYAGNGKSPNGPPGPAGNPNQPAATPQANAPQGPQGNTSHGKSNAAHSKAKTHGKALGHAKSHGKSQASHGKAKALGHAKTHGKSEASHGKSNAEHGGQNNFGHGKITICHATKSVKNPYVEITISVNGLHGHGPADDSRHHAGSWKDIIPAPPGGCPGTAPQSNPTTPSTPTTPTQPSAPVAPVQPPEASVQAPAAAAPAGSQAVLGERISGKSKPRASKAKKAGPKSMVLGANVSGSNPPRSATAARPAAARGTLPFTGTQLALVLVLAAATLLGGFALRRALGGRA